MFYFYLLRAHAGFGANGELLGVPIFTEPQTIESDFNQPRASFQACVEQIYNDLSEAEKRLPYEYEDVSGSVPADFQSLTQDVGKYNTVMGAKARQLYNGIIARAFRTRTAVLAASPFFEDASNAATWADAANAAAAVIDYKGGLSGLASDGVEYYSPTIINTIKDGANPNEILWRGNKGSGDNDQESQNFPPSLYVKEIPKVRKDLGEPPLVTPSSQIVGTQAVFNVLLGERYKMATKETKAVLRGEYGQTVKPMSQEVIDKVIPGEERITCRYADLLDNEMDKLEGEMKEWKQQDEDVLSYALFPQVATDFFKYRQAQQEKVDMTQADTKNGAYPV